MDVGYPVRRRHFHQPHHAIRRVGTYTNRMYFEAFHVDGRALLTGTPDAPRTWLAEVDGVLFVCGENAMGARRVKDDARVPASAVYDVKGQHAIH